MFKELLQGQRKNGRAWINTDYYTNDSYTIHTRLMQDLILKKLHAGTAIKSIKDRNNYDETRTITVTYDNYRNIYTIIY